MHWWLSDKSIATGLSSKLLGGLTLKFVSPSRVNLTKNPAIANLVLMFLPYSFKIFTTPNIRPYSLRLFVRRSELPSNIPLQPFES